MDDDLDLPVVGGKAPPQEQIPQQEVPAKDGIFVPPVISMSAKKEEESTLKDDFAAGLKIGYIGLGQCGGNIVDTFAAIGYARTVAINTTAQDLRGLKLKNQLCIGEGKGAGKDMKSAADMASKHRHEIDKICASAMGKDSEFIFVVAGGGGGTGSGLLADCIDSAKHILKDTRSYSEAEATKRVGVIISLPKDQDGAKVCENAYNVLTALFLLQEHKKISTIIIVDNSKMPSLLKGVPIREYWPKANNFICQSLHLFNFLAGSDSEFGTFDPADFLNILSSGIITYGHIAVGDTTDVLCVANAVEESVRGGNMLLCDSDIQKATHGALLITASKDILDTLSQDAIDEGTNTLINLLGKGATIHSGLYEDKRPGLRICVMIGGLPAPEKRILSIKERAVL